jgi:large subunit ribosomal protein L10e
MAKLRKNAAYQNVERPYTRISKFTKKNFVRGGFPNIKIVKFDMGDPRPKYDTTVKLNVTRAMNIRHNSLESARIASNRWLEKTIPTKFHLRVKTYPFHVLRENPLASGAGADRMSTGMKKSFGKVVGAAARVKDGQTVMEVRLDKTNMKVGKEALIRASKKLPCSCKVLVNYSLVH